jgi:ankyrin repeat protein
LISLGAQVDSKDINGSTPLHIALKKFNWKDQRKSFISIQRLYNSGANPNIKDKNGKTAVNIAREFPDSNVSQGLVKILTRRKIPFIETGNENGRHRLVSMFFGGLMCLIIGSYIAMMYTSLEFENFETTTICFLASVSLLTYIYAIYIKPEYAQLP